MEHGWLAWDLYFKKENIDSMAITENKLTRKDRIQLSFMSFILAEKIPK